MGYKTGKQTEVRQESRENQEELQNGGGVTAAGFTGTGTMTKNDIISSHCHDELTDDCNVSVWINCSNITGEVKSANS